jgi:hypothetical protein
MCVCLCVAGDLRLKPDVLCAGSNIMSAHGDGDLFSNNCGVASAVAGMSGTSMATPLCAGAAALVRDYFFQGYAATGFKNIASPLRPSAALVKAVMIHSAQRMRTSSGYLASYPNIHAGYGRVELSTALMFHDSSFKAIYLDALELAQGEIELICIQVDTTPPTASGAEPAPDLRVSLVWSDPPGGSYITHVFVHMQLKNLYVHLYIYIYIYIHTYIYIVIGKTLVWCSFWIVPKSRRVQ